METALRNCRFLSLVVVALIQTEENQKSREGGVREGGVAQIFLQIGRRQIYVKLPVLRFVHQRKGAQNCRKFEANFDNFILMPLFPMPPCAHRKKHGQEKQRKRSRLPASACLLLFHARVYWWWSLYTELVLRPWFWWQAPWEKFVPWAGKPKNSSVSVDQESQEKLRFGYPVLKLKR